MTSELDINRHNTEVFIDGDPIIVEVQTYTKNDDGAGGHTWAEGTVLGAQTARLVPQTDVMPQVRTPDGVVLTPTFVLVGSHDANFPRWGTFNVMGVDYRITSPMRPGHTTRAYFTKVDVARV